MKCPCSTVLEYYYRDDDSPPFYEPVNGISDKAATNMLREPYLICGTGTAHPELNTFHRMFRYETYCDKAW